MEKDQLERFGEAVEEKKEEAKQRSEATGDQHPPAADADPTYPDPKLDRTREQGEPDPRAKNSGHGKKTADKWNQ
jgi:hypothetical protein